MSIPKDLVTAGAYGVQVLKVLYPAEGEDPPALRIEKIAELLGDSSPHADLEPQLKTLFDLAMVEYMGEIGYTITKCGIEMVDIAEKVTFPRTEWPFPSAQTT